MNIHDLRSRLPERISVHIQGSDEGLTAKVSSEDGRLSNCYTQAANATELVVMVNDAVFTHFEISEADRKDIYYLPVPVNHLRMEEMFNQLVSMGKEIDLQGDSETTLILQEGVC